MNNATHTAQWQTLASVGTYTAYLAAIKEVRSVEKLGLSDARKKVDGWMAAVGIPLPVSALSSLFA